MRKLTFFVITFSLILVVTVAAMAHGPEVYGDLSIGGSNQLIIGSTDKGSNFAGYSIGFALPLEVAKFPFKLWGDFTDASFDRSGESVDYISSDWRVGYPLVHEDNLHFHFPVIAMTKLSQSDSSNDLRVRGTMLGANLTYGFNDKCDLETYFGYSLFGAEVKNNSTSYSNPSLFLCKVKLAYAINDHLELGLGYQYGQYSGTDVDGSEGRFTLGFLYGFEYPWLRK